MIYRVVRDHFETFRTEAAGLRGGEGLPRFVEQEFREFLRCGWLAGGFARFRCEGCGLDRLVAFSCKGRGFCPGCGGRRMVERAARLVDRVFPAVPVRQWVLSLPPRLRYRLAWDHALCRSVVTVLLRAVFRHLRTRARERGVADPRGGAVAVVQRFGGALNLNVHIHALVLDGVFARGATGPVTFHLLPDLTAADVADVLAAIAPGVARVLARRGLSDDEGLSAPDAWAEEAPDLAGLAAASVQGVAAMGARRGARVRRLGEDHDDMHEPALGRCHARQQGFDLHAGLVIVAAQRERLERVCRYVLRPPVAQERLSLTETGQVVLQLRHRWRDGTTQLLFDPLELLARLAVLVPRPRVNLILYHGVLAPRAAWRSQVVPRAALPAVVAPAAHGVGSGPASPSTAGPCRGRGHLWAELMHRTFGFDVLACPRCGGRLRLVALIDQAAVIQRILQHLGLPAEVPVPSPSRAPPLFDDAWEDRTDTDAFGQSA